MSIDHRARVLLIDDHPLLRSGLRQLIDANQRLLVCAEAATPDEAILHLKQQDPDLCILDLHLRGASGLDLLPVLLHHAPYLKVLVLSMLDERVYAERCLRLGAKGYLMKETAADQVVSALTAIEAGGTWLGPTAQAPGQQGKLPVETLSDRELRVFELTGDGLATRTIAERLILSEKTVEAHKANIKRKLGLASAAELARRATTWRDSGS